MIKVINGANMNHIAMEALLLGLVEAERTVAHITMAKKTSKFQNLKLWGMLI